ncbi:hypothetical protein Bca4012_037601 [Brassica carinata]
MVDTQVGEIVTFQQIQFDLINDIADFAIPEDVYVISDPLWKSNVVGYFIGDAPHVGSIIPGAKEKIDVQFISKTSFLFRTESEALRLKKPLTEGITFQDKDETRVKVGVSYPWLPPQCLLCRKRGHKPREDGEVQSEQISSENPVQDVLAKLTAVQPHQSSEVGTEFLVEASKDLGVGMFPKVGFEQGGDAVSDVNESSDNGVSKEESFENNSDVVTNVVTEKDVDKVSEREREWGTAHGHRPSLKTPEVAK